LWSLHEMHGEMRAGLDHNALQLTINRSGA